MNIIFAVVAFLLGVGSGIVCMALVSKR